MATTMASAKRRAHLLLCAVLTEHEYIQLIISNCVDVRSPSNPRRVYRIPARPGQVTVYEDGQPLERLCLLPMGWLPDDDLIVLHKLLIQADEQGYLRTANHFPVRHPAYPYLIRRAPVIPDLLGPR
jgi:hypothetical protein